MIKYCRTFNQEKGRGEEKVSWSWSGMISVSLELLLVFDLNAKDDFDTKIYHHFGHGLSHVSFLQFIENA